MRACFVWVCVMGAGCFGKSSASDGPLITTTPTTEEASTSTARTEACNDGTGAVDCCKANEPGGVCTDSDGPCWTRCTFVPDAGGPGFRSQMMCGNGHWISGHGRFPCSIIGEGGP